jgi:hypothetical protein
LWQAVRKLVGKRYFGKEVKPQDLVQYFYDLFDIDNKVKLINDVQILVLQYIEEFGRDFTIKGVKGIIKGLKNNKAASYGGIAAEIWKAFGIMKGGN